MRVIMADGSIVEFEPVNSLLPTANDNATNTEITEPD